MFLFGEFDITNSTADALKGMSKVKRKMKKDLYEFRLSTLIMSMFVMRDKLTSHMTRD